jgi:hypothetical protein
MNFSKFTLNPTFESTENTPLLFSRSFLNYPGGRVAAASGRKEEEEVCDTRGRGQRRILSGKTNREK